MFNQIIWVGNKIFLNLKIREPRQDFYHKASELFDNPCYLEEVSDVLCIALAELPALLPPAEVAEALLHVTNGPVLIARMVANQPDCFREGKNQMKIFLHLIVDPDCF